MTKALYEKPSAQQYLKKSVGSWYPSATKGKDTRKTKNLSIKKYLWFKLAIKHGLPEAPGHFLERQLLE